MLAVKFLFARQPPSYEAALPRHTTAVQGARRVPSSERGHWPACHFASRAWQVKRQVYTAIPQGSVDSEAANEEGAFVVRRFGRARDLNRQIPAYQVLYGVPSELVPLAWECTSVMPVVT
jgi:hypothetical protein